MKLKNIIEDLPQTYSKRAEETIIQEIEKSNISGFSLELANLLAFSISNYYNNLAKFILEKDYKGKKIDLNLINKYIIDQSSENYSLLHFTAQFGNKEMLIYFLRSKVKISIDKDQQTPIHTLTFAKNLNKEDINEIIIEFKKKSSNIINQRDIFYLTALHYAAYNDNNPALEALVANGATR